jgi:putative tryptophan/tyrosine transport system substrate-binding protein
MKRREVLAGIGAGAVAWPASLAAQQVATPLIGFLRNTSADDSTHLVDAFLKGLGQAGYHDGRNVRIEYRWTSRQADRW